MIHAWIDVILYRIFSVETPMLMNTYTIKLIWHDVRIISSILLVFMSPLVLMYDISPDDFKVKSVPKKGESFLSL